MLFDTEVFAIYPSPSLFFAVETRVPLVFLRSVQRLVQFRQKILEKFSTMKSAFETLEAQIRTRTVKIVFLINTFCQDVCCFDIFLPGILDSPAFFSLFFCCVLYICFFRVWTPWFLHFLFFLSASQQVRVGARSARGE